MIYNVAASTTTSYYGSCDIVDDDAIGRADDGDNANTNFIAIAAVDIGYVDDYGDDEEEDNSDGDYD
jgi:hypothetical protein